MTLTTFPPQGPYLELVRDFGADPSGTRASDGAVNAALAMAPQLAGTGIEIWARPGQYNLTSPALLRGTTHFRGAGRNITQFYAPGITGAVFKSANTATVLGQVVLEGFTVNCGNSNTVTAGIDWTGLNTPTLRDIDVRNIATAGAAGIMAVGSIADSSGAVLQRCGGYNITAGQALKAQSLNGLTVLGHYSQFCQQAILLNSLTESNLYGLQTSDNTHTADASSLKVQNCNRMKIIGFISDDAKWISVFLNAPTNCQFIGFSLNDNSLPFTVANGGLLYVAGARRCNIIGLTLEFTAVTPVAGTNGMTLDNASSGQTQDNTFTDLSAAGNGSVNVKPIHWVGGASGLRNRYNQLTMNGFSSFDTPLETDVYGSIDSRNGIVTRNRGNSTGTGAQQTIAHGLSFTPVREQIMLTPGSATAAPWHSAAPDATNIYVTAANLQPWYWATAG